MKEGVGEFRLRVKWGGRELNPREGVVHVTSKMIQYAQELIGVFKLTPDSAGQIPTKNTCRWHVLFSHHLFAFLFEGRRKKEEGRRKKKGEERTRRT